ncbi:MAG: hypothetical protein L6Q99_08745 [Planctomycetes bacterium]|nr:hypothetical protein [Planctomycetota bacterium]
MLSLLLASCLQSTPAGFAGGSAGATGALPAADPAALLVYDDFADRCVHWDTHLVRPLALSADGTKLYALNQPGARLVIFDPVTLANVAEVPIGPGAVALAERASANELWITDCVTSAITVVDLQQLAITATIRVGAEPHGIVFTPSGDRAYVACSGARRVDVVATATKQLANGIVLPVREPRALVWTHGAAWVAPLVSGNRSAPLGAGTSSGAVQDVVAVERPEDFGFPPLPDLDLLPIPTQPDPTQDVWAKSATVTGLGSVLLNAHVRPGSSEVWVVNTDALNFQSKGERAFLGGQVVSNRVTVVDVASGGPPQVIDLDALAPPGIRCAQPTGLAFDPVRPRVYVCGYGSDLVAVLDLSSGSPTWAGAITLSAKQVYPKFVGPRTCVVDASGASLYVLGKGDNSLARVALGALPSTPSFTFAAPAPVTLGYEPLSGEERQGRNHFVNARNSKSQTSSCASCHVDGRSDGLAWDLSLFLDPEGTPKAATHVAIDDKGPLVTQSMQRLAEAGPYHWRGEKERLVDFNASFVDLLEREVGGVPKNLGPDFRYLEHYVERLAYHANPHQAFDRSLSPTEARGAALFLTKPVFQGVACVACHGLPLGSSGEITKSHVPGKFEHAKVPPLRGLSEKFAPPQAIGGAFGKRTTLGAGLSHGGAYGSLRDLLLGPDPDDPTRQAFELTRDEADAIAAFLFVFDTGLAPATAEQFTVDAHTAATTGPARVARLLEQARLGACDALVRLEPSFFSGFQPRSAYYDAANDEFLWPRAIATPTTAQALLSLAASGSPVTFLGVPRLMGRPMAIDRDLDRLLDQDELAHGTDPEELDTDDDGYPDGYEVQWGLDPLAKSTSSPDVVAPKLVGTPRVRWSTVDALVIEFETDEVARVQLAYNGGIPVLRLPLQNDFDVEFRAVVNELEPASQYVFDFELKDPSGNVAHASFTASTRARVFGDPAFVHTLTSTIVGSSTNDTLSTTVTLRTGQVAPPAGYAVEAALHWVDPWVGVTTWKQSLHAFTDASGVARFDVPLPWPRPFNHGVLWFDVLAIDAPPNAPRWSEALDVESWTTTLW